MENRKLLHQKLLLVLILIIMEDTHGELGILRV